MFKIKLYHFFPALASSNYRYYFIGQLVSLAGTWLQLVAEGWLVLQMTHSALWVGIIAAIGNVPVLLLSLFAGVIVDRVDRKKLLFMTQVSSMILALILGFLTIMKMINLFELSLLAFLLGVINTIDMPARQAFMTEISEKEQLPSVIALNSSMFNGARVLGPSIAGALIALWGPGGAFTVNGISYLAAILALIAIKPQRKLKMINTSPLRAIKDGIVYVKNHPIIKALMIYAAVLSVFGWAYTTILPVIVKTVYLKDAAVLGFLYAASGLGAVLGAITLSVFSRKISASRFIFGGSLIFIISLFLFTFANSLNLAYFFMFFTGYGLVMIFSTITTTIQQLTNDSYRGRVMSIYTLAFLGLAPLGSLQIGIIANYFSPQKAIQSGVVIVMLSGLILFKKRHAIRKKYRAMSTSTYQPDRQA